jgi:hypothetical protein
MRSAGVPRKPYSAKTSGRQDPAESRHHGSQGNRLSRPSSGAGARVPSGRRCEAAGAARGCAVRGRHRRYAAGQAGDGKLAADHDEPGVVAQNDAALRGEFFGPLGRVRERSGRTGKPPQALERCTEGGTAAGCPFPGTLR